MTVLHSGRQARGIMVWRRLPRWIPVDIVTLGGLFAGSFLYSLQFYDRGLNLLDEGFILQHSKRIFDGQIPYKDFFTLTSPGAFYTQALLMKAFGLQVIVGRWAMVILASTTAAVLYLMARRLVNPIFALVPGVLFVTRSLSPPLIFPSYSWYALACVLLFCVMLDRYVISGRRGWLYAAGFTLGAAAFYKQNYAVYTLAAVVAFYILLFVIRPDVASVRSWRPLEYGRARIGELATIGAVALLTISPLMLYLLFAGAIGDAYKDTVYVPLFVFTGEVGVPYPAMLPMIPEGLSRAELIGWGFRLLALLPILVQIVVLVALLAKRVTGGIRERHATLALQCCVAFFIWLTVFPRADTAHLQNAVGPSFLLFAWLLAGLAGRARILLNRGLLPSVAYVPVTLLALLPVAILAGTGTMFAQDFAHERQYEVSSALADGKGRADGIYVSEEEWQDVEAVDDAVEALSDPGDSILVVPWPVAFYFISERDNPGYNDLLIPANLLPEHRQAVVDAVSARDVQLIVYRVGWDVNDKTFAENEPCLHKFVTDNFMLNREHGEFKFYFRDETQPPPTSDCR